MAAPQGGHEMGELIREHVFDGPHLDFFGLTIHLPFGLTKHFLFVTLGALLTFLLVWTTARNIQRVPRGLQNFLEAILVFFRDEVFVPNMGERYGRLFTPYLMTLFLFILIMNLLGLVPFGAAATSNVYVTGGLALTTLACMVFGGMFVQGPLRFWAHLIPPGVPVGVLPIIAVIELLGLFMKPFALMVRLGANMTAGHIVILALMSFIFTFKKIWFVIAPVTVLGIVLFSVLELLVAFIQAYVFTLLSAVFIGMSLNPEH